MITYRKAEIKDIPMLVSKRIEFLKEAQDITDNSRDEATCLAMTEYFKETLPDDSFIAWLAEENGDIAGTSGLCFIKRPPSYKNITGDIAYIMNMYTLPGYRNQGIATTLFSKLLDEAKAKGYTHVSLHATENGRPIYEKFGFKDTSGEMSLTI